MRDGRVGEERLADRQTIVIGRGGWLHVPEESLREAGIGDRAVVRVRQGVVELRPTDGDAPAVVEELEAPLTAAGAVVEARGVSRSFGTEVALEHLDAVFRPGMLNAVTGPSGSGKSTLLALLAGLDTPDEGEIVIGDVVLSALDREARAAFRRESIGVVGQVPGLSSALTARENVELSPRPPRPRGRRVARADDRRARHRRPRRSRRPPGRAALGRRARARRARPCDRAPARRSSSPTSRRPGSTASPTLAIGGLLADLAREHGTTVVCATHDPLVIALAGSELKLGGAAAVRSA